MTKRSKLNNQKKPVALFAGMTHRQKMDSKRDRRVAWSRAVTQVRAEEKRQSVNYNPEDMPQPIPTREILK
jgi:hypothetical protein